MKRYWTPVLCRIEVRQHFRKHWRSRLSMHSVVWMIACLDDRTAENKKTLSAIETNRVARCQAAYWEVRTFKLYFEKDIEKMTWLRFLTWLWTKIASGKTIIKPICIMLTSLTSIYDLCTKTWCRKVLATIKCLSTHLSCPAKSCFTLPWITQWFACKVTLSFSGLIKNIIHVDICLEWWNTVPIYVVIRKG